MEDYHITLEESIGIMDLFDYLAKYCYVTDDIVNI